MDPENNTTKAFMCTTLLSLLLSTLALTAATATATATVTVTVTAVEVTIYCPSFLRKNTTQKTNP